MEQDNRAAEFAVHYATVRTFAEDRRCQAKHWARRYFKLGAEARGLSVIKRSMRFPPGRGEKKSSSQFVSHYLGFRANSLALLRKAEAVLMELPLKGPSGDRLALHNTSVSSFVSWGGCCKNLETDGLREENSPDHVLDEADSDIICTPFLMAKIHLFYGGPDQPVQGSIPPDENGTSEASEALATACDGIPLTGSQRIQLTHEILQDVDIGSELRSKLYEIGSDQFFCSEHEGCRYCSELQRRLELDDEPIALEHLLDANIFADAFAMHDRTRAKSSCCSSGPGCCCCFCLSPLGNGVEPETAVAAAKPRLDLRLRLRQTWDCCCRFQPISFIRLYFGEKMAFYFAWVGYTLWSLIFISAFGLACLVYGLVYASNRYATSSEEFLSSISGKKNQSSTGSELSIFLAGLMQFVRLSFENELTIVFGCVLSLWSMTTTETWRKYESSLSYRWDMNNQLLAERARPIRATMRCCCRLSTGRHQTDCLRCLGGFSLIFTCVAIVFAVTVSIQVTRLVATSWHCVGTSQESQDSGTCFFLATALPSLAHIVIIDALDRIYSNMARKITKWERHPYSTDQDTSFAMKEFAFRFANNYSALFYIAFVRQGQISVGGLTDYCVFGGTRVDCFSQLNLLTAYYIVFRSALKSFIDYFWPSVKHCHLVWSALRFIRSLLTCCCPCLKSQLYGVELSCLTQQEMRLGARPESVGNSHDRARDEKRLVEFLEFAGQRHLASQGDDVEYLDKMILYGFMVLFGSAFFLSPVAALVALAIDLRLDASRLLIRYRRPLPRPAQGIGIWAGILDSLSYAGVFTTAAILAFTSDSLAVFVRMQDLTEDRRLLYRLVLFIAFVGGTLSLKFLLIIAIRGPSTKLKMQLKWEYWAVPNILAYERVSNEVAKGLKEIHTANEWFRSGVPLPCCPGARVARRSGAKEAADAAV